MNFNFLAVSLSDILFSGVAMIIYIVLLLALFCYVILLVVHSTTKGTVSKKDEFSNRRFPRLCRIDSEAEMIIKAKSVGGITLSHVCNSFRDYASKERKLYYDIRDVRKFVAGMSMTKTLILQGMSGTGKTSLAYAFGEFFCNSTTVVAVQPMWKERSDLFGYYNEFTGKFIETTLLQKIYQANYDNKIYIVVLDEVNIARVEYYFAEFLSLLELPDSKARKLDVISNVIDDDPVLLKGGQIPLPDNMFFVGTANNDDSTFAISDKVYDRAMIIDLDKKAEQFDIDSASPLCLSYEQLNSMFTRAISVGISETAKENLAELDRYIIEKFHITFGNRIMMQITKFVPVFIACGGTEVDALDTMIATKIIRKFEGINPLYIRRESQNLLEKFDELFGEENMNESREALIKIERNG